MEESKPENNTVIHIPVVQGISMKPAIVDDQPCPMCILDIMKLN